jgi:hypothetical protein
MTLTTHEPTENCFRERRSVRRYPIDAELAFQLIRHGQVIETGEGRTINASSDGILFESSRTLSPGIDIKLQIAWPAHLGGAIGLQLCITGRTVRVQDNRTAVRVLRHIFGTKGSRESGTQL